MTIQKREGLAGGGTPNEAKGIALDTRRNPTTAPTLVAKRALHDAQLVLDRNRRIDPARHRRAVQRVRAAWRELGVAIDGLDDVDAEEV